MHVSHAGGFQELPMRLLFALRLVSGVLVVVVTPTAAVVASFSCHGAFTITTTITRAAFTSRPNYLIGNATFF
jgi:hypothetical protein